MAEIIMEETSVEEMHLALADLAELRVAPEVSVEAGHREGASVEETDLALAALAALRVAPEVSVEAGHREALAV